MKKIFNINNHNRSQLLLHSTIAMVVFPHLFHLHWSIMGVFFLLFCWGFVAVSRPSILPGKQVLLVLTIFAVVLIVVENKGILGRYAGTSAFLVALGLKLLELKSQRDNYIVVFLSFFVALTQFLFSQSVFMAAYILVVSWLLVATLISLNGPLLKFTTLFKMAAGLVLQAVPIMVFLFVFFPRIPTPKFGFFNDSQQAISGLSEVLEPGKISRLSLSQETAFRVTFTGEIPPPQQRYWRGPVFWNNDGKRWTLPDQQAVQQNSTRFFGTPYSYSVVLEPHQQKWLFALDLPTSAPKDAYLTNESVLLSKTKVKKRFAYKLSSDPVYYSGDLNDWDRQRGLQLANKPSRRIRDLIDNWGSRATEPENIVQKALDYFHNEQFVYTLVPPPLGNNPVDEFLFETRKGFCEHYATAFATLMRTGGIPARVVTGYQGGEFNAIGNFIEVRQADAHAWTEVWLDNKGWVRIDPTAAVAPERVEQGIDVGQQIATGAVAFSVSESTALMEWLKRSRQLWASFDHTWNKWILDYDVYRQNRLLDFLGINNLLKKVLLLISVFAAFLIVISILLFHKKQIRKDQVVILYDKFCKKLARKKLLRKPSEGAGDFALRAAVRLPRLKPEINEITRVYLQLRYGRRPNPDDILKIRRLVRQFRA